jgi:TonB-dependent starch-binding outer membrane protein SusC
MQQFMHVNRGLAVPPMIIKVNTLAEVVFRADGSLKFPEDNRWGYFPGILVGWRASEENFWKENLSFANYFKLRASYGKMGMDPGECLTSI